MEIILMPDQTPEINLPLRGCSLQAGYIKDKIGLPMEIYLRLYVVSETETTLISKPDDLSKYHLHINSEDVAWSFLRLFTSPKTHFLFQKEIYTVDLEVTTAQAELAIATISVDVAQEIGYEPPMMKIDNEKFFASRDLICANPIDRTTPATVVRRQEIVSNSSSYQFIGDLEKGKIDRRDISFPSYE